MDSGFGRIQLKVELERILTDSWTSNMEVINPVIGWHFIRQTSVENVMDAVAHTGTAVASLPAPARSDW